MKRFLAKVFLFFVVSAGILAIWQWDWVTYGWMQLSGGARVILDARPVEDVLADTSVPDSVKAKLRLIEDIRRFAIDSIGLSNTPNYQTYYDQHGKPICYVLTVAEKYALRGVDFSFPVIGSFAYKGFFDKDRANAEEKVWQTKGYDTEVSPVSAYSMLGYFRDPILSGMLQLPEGRMANMLMHEMTHATLFVKDQHEFNENLANFVGDYGAERFLAHRFGIHSPEYRRYEQGKIFRERYIRHFNRGKDRLDSLYRGFGPSLPVKDKEFRKQQLIGQILRTTDTLYRDLDQVRRRQWDDDERPNNAFFIGFSTYNARRNEFETEFKNRFHGDFRQYFVYLRTKYSGLRD